MSTTDEKGGRRGGGGGPPGAGPEKLKSWLANAGGSSLSWVSKKSEKKMNWHASAVRKGTVVGARRCYLAQDEAFCNCCGGGGGGGKKKGALAFEPTPGQVKGGIASKKNGSPQGMEFDGVEEVEGGKATSLTILGEVYFLF